MTLYTLTYIYHDCFLFETEKAVIIFDFWKDPLSKEEDSESPPMMGEFSHSKNIYIIISHHHKDHFSKRIFLWKKVIPNIQFIISKDTYKAVKYMLKEGGNYQGYRPDLNSVHVLTPGEIYFDSVLKVTAFGSTDIGNSYAVEIGERKIFHAGDLNAWLWLDESSEAEIKESRNKYMQIIDKIKSEFPAFDLVMFPVDSRIGREYWWGAKYFVREILTKLFVPMHFELADSEDEKERRRIDAAAFNFYSRSDYGAYLQLASTRSRYMTVN